MSETKARGAPKKTKKSRRKKTLTSRQVAYLGTKLAKELGFQPLGLTRTARLLSDESVTPFLFENERYRLWMDKQYIAVEDLDRLTLIYVYATRKHIDSETRDDRAARKRGRGFLEALTVRQFNAAKRAMRREASQCALRARNIECGVCGADTYLDLIAPWVCPQRVPSQAKSSTRANVGATWGAR